MTFFVNQSSSTRSTLLFSLSGRLRKVQLGGTGGEEGGGWGILNQFPHASKYHKNAKITEPASSSHHQTCFCFLVTPPRRLKMPPSRLQDGSTTPVRRWKIDLQSFIYASPVSTLLFDCFSSIRTTFYAHSKYRNHGQTMVFTKFQELSLLTTQATFKCKPFLQCASCSFEKRFQPGLIHEWKSI